MEIEIEKTYNLEEEEMDSLMSLVHATSSEERLEKGITKEQDDIISDIHHEYIEESE